MNCSRCQSLDGNHNTKDCTVNRWPPSEEQWCDRCFDSNHEARSCKLRGELPQSCNKCRHEGHHQTKECTLDKTNPEDLKQFTPLFRKNIEDKLKKAAPSSAPSSKNPAQHGSLTQRGPPPKSATASSTSSTPFKTAMTKVARPFPSLTPKQQEKAALASSNLQLATYAEATANKPTAISANFFRVTLQSDVGIRKYRIVLDQVNGRDITNRNTRRAMIEDILLLYPPTANIWVTDYYSLIVSVGKLYDSFGDADHESWSVLHQRTGPAGQPMLQMDSTIFYEGALQFSQLQNYVNNPAAAPINGYLPDEDLKILNILSWKHILDRAAPLGRVRTVGKKFYPEWNPDATLSLDPRNAREVVYNVRNGFFSSMRPGAGSLLLNVNSTSTAFYPAMNLQTWINRREGRPSGPFNPCFLPSGPVRRELRNIKVTFEGTPGRVWTVNGISNQTVSNQNFTLRGTYNTTAVFTYMTTQGYQALHASSPFRADACCVNCGGTATGDEIWLPGDKLSIVAWQPVTRTIDDRNMSKGMVETAMRTPDVNQNLLLNQARRWLGIVAPQGHNPIYPDFGLDVNPALLTTVSRRILPPSLSFRNFVLDIGRDARYRDTDKLRHHRDSASWQLTQVTRNVGNTFLQVGNILNKRLHVLEIQPAGVAAEDHTQFLTALKREMRNYGFPSGIQHTVNRSLVVVNGNPHQRRNTFKAALDQIYHGQNASLILVFLPDHSAEVYSDVKWWADCQAGVPTVCIGPKAANRSRDRALLGNLILKINTKLGGVNNALANGLPQLKGTTMIVGADTTHSGKGDDDEGCPSMAGVVATYDNRAMKYLASARLQPKNTEHIVELKDMMIERLQAYGRQMRSLPRHVLFYRDGVSESQYGEVRVKELTQIRAACQAVCTNGETPPLVTLVIVGKRHHSRFYSTPESTLNPVSGMVVDTAVVAPRQFNFYLQSHDAPIGTARCAHYVVLQNDSGYNANELQEITNRICFMGSRATKGLSVCTPARYADLLCDRLRMYMRPALEGRVQGLPVVPTVRDYRTRDLIWGTPQATGEVNPWKARLDNTMFYL